MLCARNFYAFEVSSGHKLEPTEDMPACENRLVGHKVSVNQKGYHTP